LSWPAGAWGHNRFSRKKDVPSRSSQRRKGTSRFGPGRSGEVTKSRTCGSKTRSKNEGGGPLLFEILEKPLQKGVSCAFRALGGQRPGTGFFQKGSRCNEGWATGLGDGKRCIQGRYFLTKITKTKVLKGKLKEQP